MSTLPPPFPTAGPPAPSADPVPVPDLDDLSFQPLVDAAKRALPGRAPAWTDHNVSDPGVTLLEACAARVDTLLYRVNRMTPRQRTALLRLMGVAPAPACPARLRLRVECDTSDSDLTVAAGTIAVSVRGPRVRFRTVAPLLIPAGQDEGTVEAVEVPESVREPLGVSDGTSGQRFPLTRRPWQPDAPAPHGPGPDTVTVRPPGEGATTWRPVPTFGGLPAGDKGYWWDEAAAEVAFGPLVPSGRQHGAIPPRGARIHATYQVCRGSSDALTAGEELEVPESTGLTVTVLETISTGLDAESWQQALDRTALDLVPPRRGVTARDYERIILRAVPMTGAEPEAARCRVVAERRPTRLEVPPALGDRRPAHVDACLLAACDPTVTVHYVGLEPTRLTFPAGEPVTGTAHEDDTPPEFARLGGRLDAVVRTAQDRPRLWFSKNQCGWDGAQATPISAVFPSISRSPVDFTENVDAVSLLPGAAAGAYEFFFFKGERFCHLPVTVDDTTDPPTITPAGGAVVSLVAAGFPGLPSATQESVDAVVFHDGTGYVLKGAVTAPALWRPEGAPLQVSLVPRAVVDLRGPAVEETFTPTGPFLERVRDALEPVRLLGDRLCLGPPPYRRFGIEATIQPWADTAHDVRRAVETHLRRHFHPTVGGPQRQGWPWGRDVHAGDVYSALETLPQVRQTLTVALTGRDATSPVLVAVPDGGLPLLGAVQVTVQEQA
ncbi:hypothetical protein ACIP68_07810 [Streptomyces griseoviridis]